MPAYILITFFFPMFGLLTGGFVLALANPQQVAIWDARQIYAPLSESGNP